MKRPGVSTLITLFGLASIFLFILGINHLFYTNIINNNTYFITNDDSVSSTDNALITKLTQQLQAKLDSTAGLDAINTTGQGCQKYGLQSPCKSNDTKSCPRETPPQSTRERIEQILLNKKLQVSQSIRHVSRQLLAKVPGHFKLVIISAVSSNHYEEGQALLKSLHTKLAPRLNNFTVIIYDLGLSSAEHKTYKKYCRCHLVKFPFSKLPAHFRTLKCFAWKPLLIRTHFDQADFLLWVDSSVRFHHADKINELFKVTAERGIQQSRATSGLMRIPEHTHLKTFDFLGESPCIYMPYKLVQAGFGMYHREQLVELAILDSWLACAAQEACICPMGHENNRKWLRCRQDKRKHNNRKLSICHRHDQSALSIILAKLFGNKLYHFSRSLNWFGQVNRREKAANYFKELGKSHASKS